MNKKVARFLGGLFMFISWNIQFNYIIYIIFHEIDGWFHGWWLGLSPWLQKLHRPWVRVPTWRSCWDASDASGCLRRPQEAGGWNFGLQKMEVCKDIIYDYITHHIYIYLYNINCKCTYCSYFSCSFFDGLEDGSEHAQSRPPPSAAWTKLLMLTMWKAVSILFHIYLLYLHMYVWCIYDYICKYTVIQLYMYIYIQFYNYNFHTYMYIGSHFWPFILLLVKDFLIKTARAAPVDMSCEPWWKSALCATPWFQVVSWCDYPMIFIMISQSMWWSKGKLR